MKGLSVQFCTLARATIERYNISSVVVCLSVYLVYGFYLVGDGVCMCVMACVIVWMMFVCVCVCLCVQSIRVKLVQNSGSIERRYSSWIGGSILASLVKISSI